MMTNRSTGIIQAASPKLILPGRRQFLRQATFGAALFTTSGLFAEELTRTARQTEGPFYPDRLPLDTDNDLLIINDTITPAIGQVTHLSGRVLNLNGTPIRNAMVEIWQVDSNGLYIHTRSGGRGKRDSHFQGYGRFLTGSKGEYYFRTIKPVGYQSRTPHIHVIVKQGDKRLLTTQLYVKGEKRNKNDFLLSRVKNKLARESILLDYLPLKDSKTGELQAHCDIVVGLTPPDAVEAS